MRLPESEELNIGYLSRLFDNTSNCYKFFWFQAILRRLEAGKTRITFDELINEMIADAWYMVTEYNLRLASVTDNLEEVVKYIQTIHPFISSEKREVILAYLEGCENPQVLKYKRALISFVPYRLLAPFLGFKAWEWELPRKELYERINEHEHLLYYFLSYSGLETTIEVDSIWAEYLVQHREILRGWMQFKLIQYLQIKNPSVPGIAEKIEPPTSRNLTRVRKYWEVILTVDPTICDIYGHVTLADQKISVDHFVPWQYVAHDELWNLHPTTREINSSKNNFLPDWNRYFTELANLEYHAYELRRDVPQVAKAFKSCADHHLNNQDIRTQLYQDGLERAEFVQRLENVMEPVYQSAKNSGFREWEYG